MIGFPDACIKSDAGIDYDIVLDTEYATTGDQFAWTCGYYVIVEWSGGRGLYLEAMS